MATTSTRRDPEGGMFRNRIVGRGDERVDQILANPANWRTHPDVQTNEVEKSLETFGWVKDVIVNRRTGHLIDGHDRVLIAMRRDEETVPTTYIDVSLQEERVLLAILDPLAAMASRDTEKLQVLRDDIAVDMPGLELDLSAILARERRAARGLTHEVRECTCCAKRCKPGCGCYREND